MAAFGSRSSKTSSYWLRLFFYGALSTALILLDHRTRELRPLRAALSLAVLPLQWTAAFPEEAFLSARQFLRDNDTLRHSNADLQRQNLMLTTQLERYQALKADNQRLRALIDAAPRVATRALGASIITVGSAPFSRKVVLDRGSSSGAYVSQPVIDSDGIMGQISEVGPYSSEAILITDPNQAVPVEDMRSGQRAIVTGTGAPDQVDVPYLTASADVKPGDVLVSSGLGGVFPSGYPVAKVVRVEHNPNEAFLKITARPAAHLNRGRRVLLIWPKAPAPGASAR